jgi:hypothetical protein
MVQSTDSPCFELVSWTDLLDKAGHDLIELKLQVNSYSLFNCICTLNHIADWISADPRYESLSAQVDEIKKERNVEIVRQLCNRAKHFSRNKVSPTTQVHNGYGSGRYGLGNYQEGEPSYLVEVDGSMLNVLDVLSAARSKWEALRIARDRTFFGLRA